MLLDEKLFALALCITAYQAPLHIKGFYVLPRLPTHVQNVNQATTGVLRMCDSFNRLLVVLTEYLVNNDEGFRCIVVYKNPAADSLPKKGYFMEPEE